ncbi:MAG: restriction endonuclease subunit S [Chloroflexi bacterium]|nr:restriction endonuclease subunit S [Chloroflexota bacterium]
MNSDWKKGKLEELAIIEMGQSPLGETCNHEGIGTPLLNGPTEFGDYHPTPVQFTTDARKFSVPNDILFCVRGSTTGSMNWADQKYAIGRGIAAMRHRSGSEYRYFLKALIDLHLDKLLASATGSTFPNVSREQLANLDCEIPPLPEQRAIAGILGALDDKIEVNCRMNATLESMARAVFRQWFVVSEEAITWQEKSLDEIAGFLNGLALQKFPPSKNDFLPVIKISQLRKNDTVGADKANINIPTEYIIEDGDILFSWSGSLEVVIWGGGKGALNQHLFKVTSEKYPKWFYYFWTKYHLPEFQEIAAGKATTMGHIQRHHLKAAKVLVPSDQELKEMDKVMSPLLDKIIINNLESRTLGSLRDSLLPKLMRGEVRVEI